MQQIAQNGGKFFNKKLHVVLEHSVIENSIERLNKLCIYKKCC